MLEWVRDRLLPTAIGAIVLALITMYVEFTSMKHSTIEYRTATKEAREKENKSEAKQWEIIVKSKNDIVRLEEKCINKDAYYKHLIKGKTCN